MMPVVQKFEHQSMSTVFELMIASDEKQLAQSAAHAVFTKLDRLEELISRFLDVSEVAQISRLKPGEPYRVAPEFMELLLISTQLCAATKGAFDVTVGTVMDALRDVKHRWSALTVQERERALATCGMNRLVIDDKNLLIAVKPDRQGRDTPLELDFGAIGKGFALDLACDMLEKDWDFFDFLMHGGTSTVLARGSAHDGQSGWPVGVGGDWQERAGLHHVRLLDSAISGSGFEVKGAHVVDVRQGVAAAKHPAVWSSAKTAAQADALSTAYLALTWHEIVATCKAVPHSGALVAYGQPKWLDRVRRPVRICGEFPQ